MKYFKDILSEVAQPKSAEEKRFKDQHTIELIKHPVALDSQFTGEIEGVTKQKRIADPAKGEDATKYDAAYAVKDKPFKMPRNIDEEVELDEAEMEMWSVDIPKQHNLENKHSVKVKARNTREAIRKAAAKIGMKDYWMHIKIGKVTRLGMAEEIEEIEEAKATKIPSNYAAMMAKKRKKAGTSEFGSHPDKKVKKEGFISYKDLLEKVATEQDLLENPQEEIPMMMRQLHFIAYAADEIMEYLAIDGLDPEEWWQNKLAYAFSQMQSLHSYVEGDKRMMSFGDDDDDMISAAYESVEETSATFTEGEIVLESNETVSLSEEDAQILSVVFESLDEDNRNQMYSVMIEDSESFQEVLEFAREAV